METDRCVPAPDSRVRLLRARTLEPAFWIDIPHVSGLGKALNLCVPLKMITVLPSRVVGGPSELIMQGA